MTNKCDRCKKVFNHKGDYNKHLNRQNPCEIIREISVNEFQCPKCSNIYSSKSNLTRHLNGYCTGEKKSDDNNTKKIDGINQQDNVVLDNVKTVINDISKLSENISANSRKISSDLTCPHCLVSFARKDILKRHLNGRCKIKLELEREKTENTNLINKILTEMKSMKKEIIKLTKENERLVNIKNTENINNNINANNNIRVQLVAFGKEDLSMLMNSEIITIINKGSESIPELIKAIHFNTNRPENHNIYISNNQTTIIHVFDGQKWITADRRSTIRKLVDDTRKFLLDKATEFINGGIEMSGEVEHMLFDFERSRDNVSYILNREWIMDTVKLLLYNDRDIVSTTLEPVN